MALILGIETSCDETAAAVVHDGVEVVSNVVASQIAQHAVHGGVVPELAAREHLKAMNPVVSSALRDAKVTMRDIDAIAVTRGPGLMPALLVGLNFAKGLAAANEVPLIGVNHFLGHIYGAFLEESNKALSSADSWPMLALVVSGGHSSLMVINADGTAKQVGMTIDDAAGEALDKAAKLLGLGYPGGPIMEKTARNGDDIKYKFPRPLCGASGKPLAPEHKFNFSFSGVKTALLYHWRKLSENGEPTEQQLYDTVASYQEAIVDVLCRKTMRAAQEFNVKTIVLCGGVACNGVLRERLEKKCPTGITLRLAQRKYCTDNAAMIAGVGYHSFKHGQLDALDIDAFARLPIISQVPFAD
jgi:N6-L-threonylcarbamoyladenine synthase